MTSVFELLNALKAKGIRLGLGEQDNLLVRGDKAALSGALMQEIKDLKPEIVALLKQNREAPKTQAIKRIARDRDSYPVSFAQQRLWLLDQIEGGSVHYNMPGALHLKGRLDLSALEQSLDAIVLRHESLRTCFETGSDGEARQRVQPARPVGLEQIDLSMLASAAQQDRLFELFTACSTLPFDLARDLMVRAQIVKLADQEHVLLVVMHHIASDGWSMSVLIREFKALYEAFRAGKKSPLDELDVQYLDYAVWQRETLKGAALERQLDYWNDKLAGLPTVHSLPLDRPRPRSQTFSGATVTTHIGADETRLMVELCRSEDATLFMGLHAVFSALLARYSNERDIVVGSPIANREQPEIAGLIGFFVNTLVLRLDLSGTPSLRDLLAQSRQVALEAYAHQQVPFEQIVERIRPERNASHGPLFQILLALQNNEKAALDMPGFSLAEFDLPFKIAKYDLSLLVSEQDDRLELTWEYNTDLFDAATLNRLADHFGRLLQALARHPDAAVHTAELMSEAEYSRLCAWNSTAHDYCQNTPVHRLFEQRVRERPDAPAVIDGNRVLSYTELNTLANRVAHRLIDLGVALDDRVMVCMPRGLEMIVALLAALKAGAAYVVMDPEYPRDRMQYMVHDSRPAAIIATQASQNSVDGFAVPVYMLDLQMPSAGRDSNPQIAGLSSRNLGYVIYTSGSTGRPKGVLIEHRSIMRLVVNNPFAVIDAADTLAQCANPAFDASTWEIWGALTAGARLAIVPPDVLLDPERFAQAIGTYQISSMFLTTGLFNRLAEPLAAAFAQLKYLIVGGEQCDARTVSAMFQIARPEHFINGYGPTETTTFALCHEVDAAPDVSVNIPLGRPIANTTVYVLDRALQQVPLGVVGEIYIGGPGLARGYLNEPALTAERFLPDPFHPVAGGRMYRTGDLGNWRADGTIAYLGRNDFQVKIRGFRIEMGEIEHAIAACEGVREVVVAALDDQGGGKRLVAYLRARDGYHLQMDDVKRQLKASLPAHMMPAHFVEMEVFPLTANGKVDRKALPAPAVGVAAEEFVAPAGAIEIILASIWSDVLKHQGVSANDDFFQLGGHSLLATQVISKIRAALQVELSLRTLFEAPTLAALALRIEAAKMESAGLAAMPMTRVERGQRLPLSFAQQRLWFLDQLEPGSAFYNMPNPMRLIGRLDVQALCRTFDEILRRHEVLRTSFGIDQGEPVQVIKPAHKLECPIIDLSQVPDSDREKRALDLVMQDARKPFDLANGPVVRCTLVRLRETEHLVLFTMHHIVSDGWSSGVLVKEIVTLYQAFAAGSPSPLPELPLQYADFASWQRNWLQGEVLQRQLSYWKKELAGAPALLALPTDRPRPKVQAHRGANGACSIPQSTVEPLRNLAFATQSTLFMVLAAAFNVLMARLSGQSDICIGTPIANRNRNEIENLIGFFVNTLVLRTQIEPEQSFLDLLQQVRNRLLNAYMHQDIPFEQVVDALMPVRNLSHAPVFQVMLILQNAPVGALELSDLKLEPVTAELATTKFDIRLAMWEIEGRIDAYFEYDTDLFDASTIERMGRQFSCLLAAIADAPDQRLQDLPLLTGQEKQELLAHWDQMQPAFTQVSDADLELALRATNVIDLIDDITLNSPDAIALTWREHSLTYSELGRWSQRVANGLHSMGMQQGDIVGLLLDDPLMEVVATIGTLRAGGIYASFNHSYPVARLSAIIELVAPCHLITNTECIGQWSSLLEDVGSLRHVLLAAPDGEVPDLPTSAKSRKYELRQLDRQSDAAVKCNVGADDPCYIYFTSGSTGEPKAVVGRVKSLAHFVQWEIDAFRLDAATRASQLTNPSFHVYMRDVFPALCVGGTVCIPPSNAIFDPDELLRWLEHSRVSLLHCVPSLFRVLLRGCGRERLPHLKQVVVGGGAILPHDANQWFDLFGGRIELIGVYGQTETTLAKFVNRLKPVRIAEGFVPIGKPLPGAQAIVLKDNMEPCAVGEVGELFVRTPYRSLGYYRRPDLNVAAFVRNPYSRHETDILYRTGDLAMALPTGEFRYLGRKDFQVKIRGMRIELGEIEAALADCASVREAVVIAHATDADNAHLFAYLVPRELQADEHAFIAGIKRELVTVLSDTMQPSHYIVLDRMPLTANGKIDRGALPMPELGAAVANVAPRTALEHSLASIWSEVLRREPIGVHDDFFLLGGHSLLATQIVSRIRRELGFGLPLRSLFEYPTIERLAQNIEHINAGTTARTAEENASIPVIADHAMLPVSFSQQRLWFLDQFDPGNSSYNMPYALELVGQLDVDALRRSLDHIVERHETLRTRFEQIGGEPFQVVMEPAGLPLAQHDLGELPAAERETTLQWLLQDMGQAPFSLAQGGLIRVALMRTAENRHVLAVTLHHIVSDGWSTGILVRELASLYRSYKLREEPNLPPLNIQYGDYAHWQRQWLSSERLQRQLAYWQQQLLDAPALLTLPTDRPRPPVQSFGGRRFQFEIPRPLHLDLLALGRRTQSTLFMTLSAAFNILLARYSGQDDICVGTPIANRQRPEVEPLIGFFVNTLVLRTRMHAAQSVNDLLRQTRETALAAYAHQDLPFEQLVEALKPERQLSHSPLFQVMLVLQNAPEGSFELPELTLAPVADRGDTAKFDLTLQVADGEGDLPAAFEYNTDLFDESTVQRMADHFLRLLAAMVARPDARVADLDMLGADEKRQLLIHWNDSASPYSVQGLHRMVEDQARRHPQRTALMFQNDKMDYATLNAEANRLARHLRELGVGPDVAVGICMQRSFPMIIALLACFKAGGAYVAFDPAYPAERLAFMLEDARPAVILAEQALMSLLPPSNFPVLALDAPAAPWRRQSEANLDVEILPAHLAYIIYTSGSTGRPKGVAMTNGALHNLLAWQRRERESHGSQALRTLQFASLNFDVSFQEIFSTLSGGDTLILLDEDTRMDPGSLRRLIVEQQVQRVFLPNAVLQVFAGLPSDFLTALPCEIITAGEQLTVNDALVRLHRQLGGRYMFNQYGPSETHVVTQYRLDGRQSETWPAMPPIGRPIANTQIYILDKGLNPVPAGVAGELHIAGENLARGYWRRPELTAEKFIPNPFSDKAGARMYKSGDLARYTGTGEIEYLGRIDNQVKIRGFRVELGEIENALSKFEGIREAVVLAHEFPGGDRRLVAYLTAYPGIAPDTSQLREQLAASLPEYMVPGYFMVLAQFPLSANGKVDRKQLPMPETPAAITEYVAPGSPLEELVAGIWADVLALERVGVEDNFFQIGGHSLLAMRLLARIQEAVQIELTPRQLFDAPTVAAMCRMVEEAILRQIESMSEEEALALTHATDN